LLASILFKFKTKIPDADRDAETASKILEYLVVQEAALKQPMAVFLRQRQHILTTLYEPEAQRMWFGLQ